MTTAESILLSCCSVFALFFVLALLYILDVTRSYRQRSDELRRQRERDEYYGRQV